MEGCARGPYAWRSESATTPESPTTRVGRVGAVARLSTWVAPIPCSVVCCARDVRGSSESAINSPNTNGDHPSRISTCCMVPDGPDRSWNFTRACSAAALSAGTLGGVEAQAAIEGGRDINHVDGLQELVERRRRAKRHPAA